MGLLACVVAVRRRALLPGVPHYSRRGRGKATEANPAAVVLGVVLGGMVLRCALWASDAPFYPAIYRPSYNRLDGLTVGVAIALLREGRPDAWARAGEAVLVFLVGLVASATGLWINLPLSERGFAAAVLVFPLISLGFGLLVVAALAPHAFFWLARVKVPGAAWVAALAYTLYLTHKQMIHLATTLVEPVEDVAHMAQTAALATALSLGAACALHYGVERQFLKLRDRLLP